MHTGRTSLATMAILVAAMNEQVAHNAGEAKRLFPAPPRNNRTPYVGTLTGRNQPCPCGSGKKYKRCCMRARQ